MKHVFTQIEKKTFLELLLKYKDIVENKNTDGASLRLKNCAWNKITSEYNASPHCSCQVSSKQLRRLLMNLKQRQREALKEKKGVGPSTSGPSTLINPDVSLDAPEFNSDTVSGSDYTKNLTMSGSMVMTQPQSPSLTSSLPVYTCATPPSQPTTTPIALSQPTEIPLSISQIVATSNTQAKATPTSQSHPVITPITSNSVTSPIKPSYQPVSSATRHCQTVVINKNTVIEKEYIDRLRRAEELHKYRLELLQHKVREAKAKADLAEILLRKLLSTDTNIPAEYDSS